MKVQRHTVQWRLAICFQWKQQPNHNVAMSSSPFGKIADERNAAGSHGDGIRYEIVAEDGDAVACPPDGGMERAMRFRGRMAAHDMLCRETWEAVQLLPQVQRAVVTQTYLVPSREDPRGARAVARLMGLHHSTVQEALQRAYAAVSLHIYGPFDFSQESAQQEQAA